MHQAVIGLDGDRKRSGKENSLEQAQQEEELPEIPEKQRTAELFFQKQAYELKQSRAWNLILICLY